jgi:glutamine synthetase
MAKATSAKTRVPKASSNGAGSAASLAASSSTPGRSARMAAISAVTNYRPSAPPMNFMETPTHEL